MVKKFARPELAWLLEEEEPGPVKRPSVQIKPPAQPPKKKQKPEKETIKISPKDKVARPELAWLSEEEKEMPLERIEPKPTIVKSVPDATKIKSNPLKEFLPELQYINSDTMFIRGYRKKKAKAPKLSVILPLYNTKYIGWLAFESLCRQEDASFPWELVVAEETQDKHNPIGWEEIENKYVDRLQAAGCISVVYLALPSWVPLSVKLNKLIENCDKDSRVLARQAGDMYSPATRLTRHFNIIYNKRKDWVVQPKTILYRIKDAEQMICTSDATKDHFGGDSCFNTLSMDLARSILPLAPKKISVDRKFFTECKKVKKLDYYINDDDSWLYGFNTHGFGNLSPHNLRDEYYTKVDTGGRWYSCPIDIRHYIPYEITEKLEESRKYLAD